MRHRDVQAALGEFTRIGAIIYLAGEAYDTDGSDQFRTFCEDHDAAQLAKIFGEPSFAEIEEEELEQTQLTLERLIDSKRLGFLVKFETPIREWHDDSSFSCSWGYYRSQWIYAEQLEDAIDAGVEWARQQAERKPDAGAPA